MNVMKSSKYCPEELKIAKHHMRCYLEDEDKGDAAHIGTRSFLPSHLYTPSPSLSRWHFMWYFAILSYLRQDLENIKVFIE